MTKLWNFDPLTIHWEVATWHYLFLPNEASLSSLRDFAAWKICEAAPLLQSSWHICTRGGNVGFTWLAKRWLDGLGSTDARRFWSMTNYRFTWWFVGSPMMVWRCCISSFSGGTRFNVDSSWFDEVWCENGGKGSHFTIDVACGLFSWTRFTTHVRGRCHFHSASFATSVMVIDIEILVIA